MSKTISLQDAKLAKSFAELMANMGLLVKGTKTQFTQILMEVH